MEENQLFTQLSSEEAVTITGGGLMEAAAYLTVIQSLLPEMAGSPEVLTTAFLFLIGVLSLPSNQNKNLVNNAPVVGSPVPVNPSLGATPMGSSGAGFINIVY